MLALAYKDLDVADGKGGQADQAILMSGESGTRRTKTVKIVMRDLAMIQLMTECFLGDAAGEEGGNDHQVCSFQLTDKESVVTKVLESNSIIEAFDNAKIV